MSTYAFYSDDFALSEEGVHLLRSNFNYKTISYDQVEEASIKRGSESKNVFFVAAVGIALVLFAFYQSRWVIGLFVDPTVYHIYIESIILAILPGAVGIYCIYIAFKKGPILHLKDGQKVHQLRMRKVYKSNQDEAMVKYLRSKISNRFY